MGCCDFDAPAFRAYFQDSADDQISYFWDVAEADWTDGEEFVGFHYCAGQGGDNRRIGVVGGVGRRKVGSMATRYDRMSYEPFLNDMKRLYEDPYRIH